MENKDIPVKDSEEIGSKEQWVKEISDEISAEISAKEKKYKRKNRLLVLLLVLLLSFIGCFIYYNENNKAGLPRQKNAALGYLPGMSESEIQAEMDKKVAESELAISINSQLNFKSGSAEGFLRIENNVNNHYLILIEMYRKDTNELIYQSGAIEPGYYLEKDKLKVNLAKGTYPVTVKFKAYHMLTEEFIGEAQANSDIVIEN